MRTNSVILTDVAIRALLTKPLSKAEAIALWWLVANLPAAGDVISLASLAETLKVPRARLSQTIKRLCEIGFLVRGAKIALSYLRAKFHATHSALTDSAEQKAHNDLYVLGIMDAEGKAIQSSADFAAKLLSDPPEAATIRELLSQVPGGKVALSLIEAQADVRSEIVGQALRDAHGLPWASSTTQMAGTKFRAWARYAGLATAKGKRKAQ